MRNLALVLVCAVVCTVPSLAQDGEKPKPEFLLQKIDNYKPPLYTGEKDDPDYRRDWMAGFLRYLEKKNDLIWNFVKEYPEHERAEPLMTEWYQNLGGGVVPTVSTRVSKAILSIDTLLVNQPPKWVVQMGKFWRAYYNLCLPWNQLRSFDRINVPADDPQRRAIIQLGMAAINEFTKEYPDDERATKLYDVLAQAGRDPISARAIYAKVIADYPDHPALEFFKGKLHRYDSVGDKFEFSFDEATSGEPVSDKDYEGKVVLMVFWASNLEPCREQLREAKRLWFRYQKEGLEIVDVALDTLDNGDGKTKYLNYVHDNKFDWKHYFQGAGWASEFSRSWGVNTIPTMFLIDRKGILRYVDAHEDTEKKIKELLAQKEG